MSCRDSGPDMPGLLIFQEKQILKFTTLLTSLPHLNCVLKALCVTVSVLEEGVAEGESLVW